jgi:hypothetical protein
MQQSQVDSLPQQPASRPPSLSRAALPEQSSAEYARVGSLHDIAVTHTNAGAQYSAVTAASGQADVPVTAGVATHTDLPVAAKLGCLTSAFIALRPLSGVQVASGMLKAAAAGPGAAAVTVSGYYASPRPDPELETDPDRNPDPELKGFWSRTEVQAAWEMERWKRNERTRFVAQMQVCSPGDCVGCRQYVLQRDSTCTAGARHGDMSICGLQRAAVALHGSDTVHEMELFSACKALLVRPSR